MKYKKIIEDKQLNNSLKSLNIAEVARRVGKSKTYIYEAIAGKYNITENLYLEIKAVVSEILNKQNKQNQAGFHHLDPEDHPGNHRLNRSFIRNNQRKIVAFTNTELTLTLFFTIGIGFIVGGMAVILFIK